ncbi:hypothetical protein NO559_15165 [Dasania sp. GY-MA-18]|uniref:Ig-like domain-containing protein n=1 Tax=Dasania phycosphaerae TaxID=2950436 RepID=A0A9J6RRA0_9GAMM|nr:MULTISPECIES: hypothetical protein [Dasania]MCR8924123.1 hypothetical protein [Dasania sp. GY-MA-18]MCZ0866696.1 hypothetical protein [Dasania phycosphaerae]MCZ0870281.1 hypothetical protein [Dasania phycosphaerae]
MNNTVSITAKRQTTPAPSSEPATLGIPYARGQLKADQPLALTCQQAQLPLNTEITAYWNDGSVRWLLIKTLLSSDIKHGDLLTLAPSSAPSCSPAITLDQSPSGITVNTGSITCTIGKQPPLIAVTDLSTQAQLNQNIKLLTTNDQAAALILDDLKVNTQHPTHFCTIELAGHYLLNNTKRLNLSAQLSFYSNSSLIEWQLTVHNPAAAKHKGGFWDLGDEHSLFFNALSFDSQLHQTNCCQLQAQTDSEWFCDNSLQLLQASSGGEHWQSANHVNHQGNIPLSLKGYKLTQQQQEVCGLRADPIAHCSNSHTGINAYIEKFWQNFPKAVSLDHNTLSLQLFPSQAGEPYELQGGEKKTHRLLLDINNNRESLLWARTPSQLVLDREIYAKANTLPHFASSAESNALQQLINLGVEGDNNFFSKREKIDEYGWRHFGDLYADHETLYQSANEVPLCSHYNNQYDPALGFAKQYMASAKPQWLELFDDLSRHILDIDLYDTDLDRDEYNHGLFWHTDHYLDAGTCSHRTFSKQHLNVEHTAQSGGGPGTEHCYTTGLRYYYYFTGNLRAKEAVLKLNSWMQYAQEGTGAILERLLAIKTKDIPLLKRLNKGLAISPYRYPLTRGTGNYISTLLDSYYLDGKYSHIEQIEFIIRNTIHPSDIISERHFENIEQTWSYTIFLQALTKYLHYKVSENSFDKQYTYARDCLLHYAQWMQHHERPYLEQIDALEYPNHTWAAQDLRKAHILFEAYYFSPQPAPDYRQKAERFLHYVTDTLQQEPTRSFTRILAILMQNQHDYEHITPLIEHTEQATLAVGTYGPAPKLKRSGIITNIIKDLVKATLRFSYQREKKWLTSRLS